MKLDLYYFPECPYCQKVLLAIDELSLNNFISLLNIREDRSALEKLVKDTGRRTVPCLYIDDNPMHESDDIVYWLRKNKERIN